MNFFQAYPIKAIKQFFVVFILTAASTALFAQPNNYPNRPIKMIIPFAPGGASDFIGRIISVKLGEVLGQQIIVDNP
jgi:tripartite-type tricarboxylate transporter receptor subunit TctC